MLKKSTPEESATLFQLPASSSPALQRFALATWLLRDCEIHGRHRRRLHLTPGMTGGWQILDSARIPLHKMAKIDCLYVAKWSFRGDVKILARTVPYVFSARGI